MPPQWPGGQAGRQGRVLLCSRWVELEGVKGVSGRGTTGRGRRRASCPEREQLRQVAEARATSPAARCATTRHATSRRAMLRHAALRREHAQHLLHLRPVTHAAHRGRVGGRQKAGPLSRGASVGPQRFKELHTTLMCSLPQRPRSSGSRTGSRAAAAAAAAAVAAQRQAPSDAVVQLKKHYSKGAKSSARSARHNRGTHRVMRSWRGPSGVLDQG